MGKGFFPNKAGLLLLLLATACATPKPLFDCKRDPAFTQKLDRVLVVLMNEEQADASLQPHFSGSVTGEIVSLLNQHGIQAQVTSPNPNELDPEKPILQAIDRFRPHQVLQFGVTEVRQGRYVTGAATYRRLHTEVATLVFEAKLKDMQTHKTVWRAHMSYWFQPDPSMVAKAFVDKLLTENLIDAGH